jgi:2-polyprenyl-3-methyl-5-hydroxy-6-metoxy-1,4-benzoquinol methylase
VDGAPCSRWLDTLASWQAIRSQRRTWDGRVETWDSHNDPAMEKVADAVLAATDITPAMKAIDLGTGTGRLALPLAARGAEVLGVDVSSAMIQRLEEEAQRLELGSVRGLVLPLEQLSEPPESYDVIVSNYALHHLRDADKARLVSSAFRWLRPGGQLVIADMMFGRGATTEDRRIIAGKLRALARRGLPGYWRILKNAVRFTLRVEERPLTQSAWQRLVTDAGFTDVRTWTVVAEAGVVAARKPAT